jgi:hypothetical protein
VDAACLSPPPSRHAQGMVSTLQKELLYVQRFLDSHPILTPSRQADSRVVLVQYRAVHTRARAVPPVFSTAFTSLAPQDWCGCPPLLRHHLHRCYVQSGDDCRRGLDASESPGGDGSAGGGDLHNIHLSSDSASIFVQFILHLVSPRSHCSALSLTAISELGINLSPRRWCS